MDVTTIYKNHHLILSFDEDEDYWYGYTKRFNGIVDEIVTFKAPDKDKLIKMMKDYINEYE